jgi:hypothetical protein
MMNYCFLGGVVSKRIHSFSFEEVENLLITAKWIYIFIAREKRKDPVQTEMHILACSTLSSLIREKKCNMLPISLRLRIQYLW